MNFNDKIDKFMSDNNIKDLKRLAILSDIPYTTLRDFYNKKSADNSRLSTIRKLSEYMDCSLDYLAFDDNVNFDNGEIIELSNNVVSIPVYGIIKAGVPMEAQENILEYVDIPKEWLKGNKKYYGLKIQGDSMAPKYLPNDIVVFEQTNDMQYCNGKDCAIMVNGYDATFKKFTLKENGVILTPLNLENSDNYQVTFYDNKQVESFPIKVIGIAKRRISDL